MGYRMQLNKLLPKEKRKQEEIIYSNLKRKGEIYYKKYKNKKIFSDKS
jgi:hypothetical protein